MRYIFTLLITLTLNISFSQTNNFEKPNYKRIKKEVKKRRSELYYHRLFKKFTSTQSKMTLKEKRHLYYGYVFQKNYNPFGFSKYRDSLNIYAHKRLSKKSISKMLIFSEFILSDNPFDLEVLTYKAYLHKKNKDEIGYRITKNQLKIIYDAILSSGDGKTKKTAYHVIYRNHKTDILKHKKLTFNGFRKTIDKYRIEYLNVKKNNFGIRGVYFNVSAFKINLKSKR